MTDPAEKMNSNSDPYAGASSSHSAQANKAAIESRKILAKAKSILSDPKGIWSSLKDEQISIANLYKEYLIPLAAVGALCGFLGMWIFGISFMGVTVRTPFFSGLIYAVVQTAISLIGIGLFGFIVHKLSTKFGGNASLDNGIKLVGYGATAALLAHFLSIIPALGMIGGLLGLYSLYLMYQGIPVMTGVPTEKRLPFFATTIVCFIVAGFILGMITATLSPWSPGSAMQGISIQTKDGVFDPTKLEQGLKEFEKLLPQAPKTNP